MDGIWYPHMGHMAGLGTLVFVVLIIEAFIKKESRGK